jgi:hypothetical protein
MNEESKKEFQPLMDKDAYLAEIERLYLNGLSTVQISIILGPKALNIARNLREIKKRWSRAAARQQALAPTRCGAVYEEAMDGWQRSQVPKNTTTEHLNKEKVVDKTVNRRQDGPGDKTFLQAAVAALKALRQFAPGKEADLTTAKTREMTDGEYLLTLHFLTPEQMEHLSDVQLQKMRKAIEIYRRELDARKREERRKEEQAREERDRQAESAGLHAEQQTDRVGDPRSECANENVASDDKGNSAIESALAAAIAGAG